jgi:methylenetetrahydrofolate reductase (NADPH)
MLREKLQRGEFVITAEITPPLAASRDAVLKRAEPLAGIADAVNVTDAASARVSVSSIAAAAILAAAGIEPVAQVTCRDRNRIALASDLLGAAALGVENFLILHGDDPKAGDMPEARPVYDLDSRAVIALARDMRDLGTLPSGREIDPRPDFHIGCADTPIDPGDDWLPTTLAAKSAAGADFVQTQFCFDVAVAKRYFARLKEAGITARLKFIVGVGPLLSLRQARFMNDGLFGVSIPPAVMERLEAAGDERAEGQAICIELMASLAAIEGVAGVHVMAPMQSARAVADIIKASGLRT